MNSGVNFRRAASTPLRATLAVQLLVRRHAASFAAVSDDAKTQLRTHEELISARAKIACHEDHGAREIHFPVVAQRQSRLVENAQQQVPQSVTGLFDFIEQDEADFDRVCVILVDHFLAQ